MNPTLSAYRTRRRSWLILRMRAVRYACQGLRVVLAEPHARIHTAATFGVLVLGTYCGITRLEWCLVAASVAAVWAAESFNTALEHVCNAAVPELHPMIARAKDAAAGGVLICAIGSVVIGVLVFLPYLSGAV